MRGEQDRYVIAEIGHRLPAGVVSVLGRRHGIAGMGHFDTVDPNVGFIRPYDHYGIMVIWMRKHEQSDSRTFSGQSTSGTAKSKDRVLVLAFERP